jgi:hypothetical protein
MLNGMSALTSVTGTLALTFVDTSGAVLSVRKLGYDPQTVAVGSLATDSSGLTVVLKRSAQTLPTVVTKAKNVDSVATYISPSLRGFEERRHEGFGNFVSEAVLRKAEGWRLADLLPAHLPGAHIMAGRGSARTLVGRTGCPVTVYLDGVLFYKNGNFKNGSRIEPPPDFGLLLADEYAGIEYYASSATLPIQFGADRTAACGTVLLWTRER